MSTETKAPKVLTEAAKDRKQRKVMRQRAAYLSITQLSKTTYQVWGGESPHIITVAGGQIHCDCKGWEKARLHNCSHVMKWRLVYGDLKRREQMK